MVSGILRGERLSARRNVASASSVSPALMSAWPSVDCSMGTCGYSRASSVSESSAARASPAW